MKVGEKSIRHYFQINPWDNSGERLMLETQVIQNGDGENGVYLNQILTLNSYSNSASFSLGSATFTPAKLRKLAEELEVEIEAAKKLV